MAFCYECGRERPASHPEAFSSAHKDEEARRRSAKLANTPFSRVITIMRRQSAPTPAPRPMSLTPAQKEARAAVLAARKAAGPTPKERAEAALRLDRGALAITPASRTSVLDAEAEMSCARSPAATQRLLDQEVDDMLIRAKGLTSPRQLKTGGRWPDLTG
jgi:hypothetical protein